MDRIKDTLKTHISDDSGKKWVDDLFDGDEDCRRLGVCLGIELKFGNEIIDTSHLKEIFNDDDYDSDPLDKNYPRFWFHEKLISKKKILCSSDCCIIPSTEFINGNATNNNYVTFLNFYRLKKYYLDNFGVYTPSQSNSYDYIIDFILKFPDLLDYAQYFGAFGINPVWVTTEDEFLRCKDLDSDKNCSTNVMNSLGLLPENEGVSLFPNTGNMFFKVTYPKNMDLVFYQPTSLNKNWRNVKNDIFVSYIKEDKFGRTYSTDGTKRMAKESIHEPFGCSGKGLNIEFIDKFDIDFNCDKSNILEEGLNRFHS